MKGLSHHRPKGSLRARLFRQQHGRCFWCDGQMVLENYGIDRQLPNFATLEHLWDRWHPLRTRNREGPIALACHGCNNQRTRWRGAELDRCLVLLLTTLLPPEASLASSAPSATDSAP